MSTKVVHQIRSLEGDLDRPRRFRRSRRTAKPRYPLTDCGNAERLIDYHGESIRFCPAQRQWFAWNGCRWVPDEGAVVQLAKKTVRAIRLEQNFMLSQVGEEDRDVLRQAASVANWAARSESAKQISAMLRLAESDPRIVVEPDELDADGWVLNLANGSVELKSGRFREHRPEELHTKLAGALYDSKASCPRWERFLNEVFEPNPDLIPYLQKAVGYTLTGETREECVFVLVGGGRNGKSTFIGVLHELLGHYGGVAEMDTFLSGGATKLREDVADMRGRRYISSQEPFMNSAFSEATLKWVSGGDRLRARRLYEHAQEFGPTHKLWLAMNQLPKLRVDDNASWNRLRIIPFDVSFNNRADKELKHELTGERSGILNWAIKGCRLWQRTGLRSTASMESATASWRTRRGLV